MYVVCLKKGKIYITFAPQFFYVVSHYILKILKIAQMAGRRLLPPE